MLRRLREQPLGGQRLPTDSFWSVLSRHTARGLGAQLHSHIKTHPRPLPEAGGPVSLGRPTQRKRGPGSHPPLIPRFPPQSRRPALQTWLRHSAALQMGQRQPRSWLWKLGVSDLLHSEPGESNEREILFFPPSRGGGKKIRFCGEETGQEVVQIFLETWEFNEQGPLGPEMTLVQSQF